MRKLLCRLFDHNWRYNFPSIPNKRICKFCKKREEMDLRSFNWDKTFSDSRSDEQLINDWHK